MPRRLKQRARGEGTEWASEPRCCSAVKKVSARTLLYFLCSSCAAVRAHYTLSDRLILSGHGGDGAGEGDSAGQGQGRGRAGAGQGQGRGRPGPFSFFLFLI